MTVKELAADLTALVHHGHGHKEIKTVLTATYSKADRYGFIGHIEKKAFFSVASPYIQNDIIMLGLYMQGTEERMTVEKFIKEVAMDL